MFGFGDRRKFNGTVDTKLNNEYQIDTNQGTNPSFPGPIFYGEMLDIAWFKKLTVDEAALYIATLYFCGVLEKGRIDEAKKVHSRIYSVASFCLPRRMISQQWWDKFSNEIEKVAAKCALNLNEEFDDDIPF